MRKPDTIVDEIHEIRRRIAERTAGMTSAERAAYFNQRSEIAAKKYGFVIYQKPESQEDEESSSQK